MLRRLHPFILAPAPILLLYAENAGEAAAFVVAAAIAASVVGTALIYGLALLVFREGVRAALLTSLAVLLFFAYGHIFDALWDIRLMSSSQGVHRFMAAACVLIWGGVAWKLRRTQRSLEGFSRFVGVFASILLASASVQSVAALVQEWGGPAQRAKAKRAPPITEERADLPDIYYIIVDGYARNDTLANVYGYDNTAFTDGLKARGFFVAEKSRSNYMMTHFSLAATLNLQYITESVERASKKSKSKTTWYKQIQNNEVAKFLQAKGYTYIHFATMFAATETSKVADEVVRFRPAVLQNEFISVLWRTTALRSFESSLADLHLFLLQGVQSVPARQGPTFTFLHLLLPHNPYVFDREGNVRSDVPLSLQFEEKTGGWSAKEEYVDQLVYLNGRLREIVDTLVRDSPQPPVIILQSDHGSASSYGKGKDWRTTFYPERTGILNAWYAPPAVRERLTDDMHSVNTFRILFSSLFGADYPLLERHIWASWYKKPNAIHDVTAQLDVVDGIAPAVVVPVPGDPAVVGELAVVPVSVPPGVVPPVAAPTP